jgi:NAD(P)H-quinone oxidoreductase subunit 4
MASLALPGMSGFVSEIAVFLGMATSDVYSTTFKTAIIIGAAVGVVLSPIYLLSMLRRIFYGDAGKVVAKVSNILDIRPREAFVAACLLVPIIGIGLYPKLATQVYDAKTVEVASRVQTTVLAAGQTSSPLFAHIMVAPRVTVAELATTPTSQID